MPLHTKRLAKINKEGGSLSATIIFRTASSKMFEIRLINDRLRLSSSLPIQVNVSLKRPSHLSITIPTVLPVYIVSLF